MMVVPWTFQYVYLAGSSNPTLWTGVSRLTVRSRRSQTINRSSRPIFVASNLNGIFSTEWDTRLFCKSKKRPERHGIVNNNDDDTEDMGTGFVWLRVGRLLAQETGLHLVFCYVIQYSGALAVIFYTQQRTLKCRRPEVFKRFQDTDVSHKLLIK